jgi:transketolase
MRTIIGKNAPGFEGFNKAHSGPIGARAIAAVKRAGGLPEDLSFYVPEDVVRYLRHVQNDLKKAYSGWKHLVMEQPESSKKLVNNLYYAPTLDRETEKLIDDIEFQPGEMIASRQTGGVLLGKLLKSSKLYVAGAADLTSPCLQGLDAVDAFSKTARGGKLLFFGVREHAMAGICNGLALNGAIRATCATFLSFSDYLRPALRLSALMGLPVIYTFAYDSVWNGEDGPTHQPIEQIPGLRAIPGLLVIRPADAEEALEAWRIALGNESSPTAILVTRQKLRVLEKPTGWKQEFQNGAYVIQESSSEKTKLTIFASGSEVGTTVDACSNIDAKDIRIVSMPCRERFLNLPVERIRALIPTGSMIAIIEASRSSGWEALQKYGAIYVKSIDRFGGSAPGEVVAENLGVGPKALASWIESVLHVY